MVRAFIFFCGLWVIFSGFFKPFFLVSGLLSSAVITIVYAKHYESNFHFFSWVTYILWLFYQMIISSLSITKIVWQRKPKIAPTIAAIKHRQVDSGKIAIIANSITLTPGTVSIYVDEENVLIHSLLDNYQGGVEDIIRRVEKNISA